MTVQSKNDTVMKGTDVLSAYAAPRYESPKARRARVVQYIKDHPQASTKEVMKACGVARSMVNMANEIVRPGQPMPRAPRPVRPGSRPKKPVELTHEQRRARRRDLIEYARHNPTAQASELAEKFGLVESTVGHYLYLTGLSKGRNIKKQLRDPGRYLRKDPKRVAILTQAVQEDWTLARTAGKLGITRERVRQLRLVFLKEFPDIKPPVRVSLHQAAQMLGISRHIVWNLAQKNGLGRQRGKEAYCFFEEEVDQLFSLVEEYRTHKCEVCGKYFERTHLQSRHCSGNCRVKGFAIRLCQPNKDNRKAYQWGEVTERVKRNKKKPTRWLSWAEARDFAGVTSMQLVYLRKKGIVRTRPTPSGENRQGTVYTEYALEDMKIVKDFKGRPAR